MERILQNQSKGPRVFNEYFYSVFNNDTSSPPPQAPENGDLSVPLFTVGQVLSVLKNLNVNKAVGPDGISGFILKQDRSSA